MRSPILRAFGAAAIVVALATPVYIGGNRILGGGGGGANWAGTFDCYGTTGCPSLPSPASCTSTISSGLQTALNNATGGAVICLNTGSYGNISLNPKSYSSVVTVQPVSNAAVTMGTLALTTVTNLHVTGNGGGSATMSIGGSNQLGGGLVNVTIDYSTFTGCVIFSLNATFTSALIDHDRFDNLGYGAPNCSPEGRVEVYDSAPAPNATALTISNSHFGGHFSIPSGCSDGMQIDTDDGGGTFIGPGNEFTGIVESSCSAHADPISYAHNAGPTTITGNYFHGNGDGSGGIFTWGAAGTIKNNVFLTDISYGCVGVRGSTDWTFSHNYFGSDCIELIEDTDSPDSGTMTSTNEAFNGGGYTCTTTGATCVTSYNLNIGVAGTGNITGTAVLVSSPASGYYHYQLDSTSPGYHAASDGKSMGICDTCG